MKRIPRRIFQEEFKREAVDLKSLLETGKSGGMVRDKATLIAAGTEE